MEKFKPIFLNVYVQTPCSFEGSCWFWSKAFRASMVFEGPQRALGSLAPVEVEGPCAAGLSPHIQYSKQSNEFSANYVQNLDKLRGSL